MQSLWYKCFLQIRDHHVSLAIKKQSEEGHFPSSGAALIRFTLSTCYKTLLPQYALDIFFVIWANGRVLGCYMLLKLRQLAV